MNRITAGKKIQAPRSRAKAARRVIPSIDKSTHADVTNLHELDTSSFAGAEMRSGNEKPAGNTLCIVKGFEAAWAFFCPAKPCVSLSTDGKV